MTNVYSSDQNLPDDYDDAAAAVSTGNEPKPGFDGSDAVGLPVDSGEEAGHSISDAQKAARRRNGAQSRGPTGESGKRLSRANAMKHGGYAKVIPVINYGPLKEDPDEILAFTLAVIDDLNPGESGLLRIEASVVADWMWKQVRLQAYEVAGYTASEWLEDGIYQPDWHDQLAQEYRSVARTIRRLGEPNLNRDDLEVALVKLLHDTPGTYTEIWKKLEGALDADVLVTLLLQILESHFRTAEDAACAMDASAESLQRQADNQRHADRGPAARAELAGTFTLRVLDAMGRVDRELDRALKRYWDTKERLDGDIEPS